MHMCVFYIEINFKTHCDKFCYLGIRIEDVFTRFINLPDQEREQYV